MSATPYDPMRKVMIAQLMAHHATLAAAVAQTESTLITLGVPPEVFGQEPEDREPGCPHPVAQLADTGTLDQEQYECRACGQTFDHHPHLSVEE